MPVKQPEENEKIMSEIPFEQSLDSEELLEEYQFDYRQAKPNRFAVSDSSSPTVIVLDQDVSRVFKTSEAVNQALRALIQSQNFVP